MKLFGAALATTITYSLDLILVSLLKSFNSEIIVPSKWFFMDVEALWRIPKYLKFGFPAAIMLMMEWWGYDITTIFSGWIGVNEQATTILCFQFMILSFMDCLGITFAATSFVGNALGENQPNKAKTYTYAAIIFCSMSSLTIITFIVIFKDELFSSITSHPDVLRNVDKIFFIM
jgi:Na+-driven multidrug efflux pump